MSLLMPHWLAKRAALTPDRPCLTDGEVEWNFQELDRQARQTAKKLSGASVGVGSVIGILMGNSRRAPQLLFALQYLGAVAVVLNIRLAPPELVWQLRDAGCGLLIHDAALDAAAEQIKAALPELDCLAWRDLEAKREGKTELSETIDLDRLHTVLYTSGTTGYPKGVMLSNGNHWWSAMGSALNLGVQPEDKWLICVPLFHMSGLSIILRSVIGGFPVIIQPGFSLEAANRAIQQQKVTIVSVVSSMLSRMLDCLGDGRYPAEFRCMLVGGGPVPYPLLCRCREKQIPVYQTYGLTETASQFATLSHEHMDSKLGSAGKALFTSELKIEGETGAAAAGEQGEILVRGPNVTAGYLHMDGEKSAAFRNGWFYTGDMGYLDEAGFLYVLDRRSDLIISGGENVYPAEIEAVLCAHPLIEEAGVIGRDDLKWGRVPVAFVKMRPDAAVTEAELRAYCRDRLAHFKCPQRFFFIDQLPRNAANKLLRRELADKLPPEK